MGTCSMGTADGGVLSGAVRNQGTLTNSSLGRVPVALGSLTDVGLLIQLRQVLVLALPRHSRQRRGSLLHNVAQTLLSIYFCRQSSES